MRSKYIFIILFIFSIITSSCSFQSDEQEDVIHKDYNDIIKYAIEDNKVQEKVKYIENEESKIEYSGAVKPPVRRTGNRQSGQTETAFASLLA